MVDIGDYSYEIQDGNVAIVYYRNEEIWQSRPFRLLVQAETQAKDYIAKCVGDAQGGVDLKVQKLSVDPNSLFNRPKPVQGNTKPIPPKRRKR